MAQSIEFNLKQVGTYVNETLNSPLYDLIITALPYTESSCGRTFTLGLGEIDAIVASEHGIAGTVHYRAIIFRLNINGAPVMLKRIVGSFSQNKYAANYQGVLKVNTNGSVASPYVTINVDNALVKVPFYDVQQALNNGADDIFYGPLDFSANVCNTEVSINDRTCELGSILASGSTNETAGPVFETADYTIFTLYDYDIASPEGLGKSAISISPSATMPVTVINPVSSPVPVTRGAGIGSNGNAWNAAAVAAAGVSVTVDTLGDPNISIYGSVSAATTVSVNVSADGATWWPSTQQAVLAAAGDFYLNFTSGARYIQLVSSAAATITATVSAK